MIRDICKELSPECLIITTCSKICNKVKEHITHEVFIINRGIGKTYKRMQGHMEYILNHKECPYCQSQDIARNPTNPAGNGIKMSTTKEEYVLCLFCDTLFTFDYRHSKIKIDDIRNFSQPLQSSHPTTFKKYIDLKISLGYN